MSVNTINNIIGVILAGGQSSRMGSDKASIQIKGGSFLQAIVTKLCRLELASVIIAGEESDSLERVPKVTYLKDQYKKLGPLSGIQSALSYTLKVNSERTLPIEGMLIVPVDMPNLTNNLLLNLIEEGKQMRSPTCYQLEGKKLYFPLYLPVNKSLAGIIETLLIHSSDVRMSGRIKTKDLSMREMLTGNGIQSIDTNEPQAFVNINTPEDLERFKSQLTIGN